jgi:hypothetical protein
VGAAVGAAVAAGIVAAVVAAGDVGAVVGAVVAVVHAANSMLASITRLKNVDNFLFIFFSSKEWFSKERDTLTSIPCTYEQTLLTKESYLQTKGSTFQTFLTCFTQCRGDVSKQEDFFKPGIFTSLVISRLANKLILISMQAQDLLYMAAGKACALS